MEVIKIGIPFSEIEQRKARVEKALNFDKVDRVPVQLCIAPWYWLNELKVNYKEYRITGVKSQITEIIPKI